MDGIIDFFKLLDVKVVRVVVSCLLLSKCDRYFSTINYSNDMLHYSE